MFSFDFFVDRKRSKSKRYVHFEDSEDSKQDDELDQRSRGVQQKLRLLAGHKAVGYLLCFSLLLSK